jgi:hypothetical protein
MTWTHYERAPTRIYPQRGRVFTAGGMREETLLSRFLPVIKTDDLGDW